MRFVKKVTSMTIFGGLLTAESYSLRVQNMRRQSPAVYERGLPDHRFTFCLVSMQRDRTISGSSTISVRVLLGKREDFFTVVARKIAEFVGETSSKPVLISINVPEETSTVFKGVMAALAKHKDVW